MYLLWAGKTEIVLCSPFEFWKVLGGLSFTEYCLSIPWHASWVLPFSLYINDQVRVIENGQKLPRIALYNVNNMTHSVCWWWLCGRRVCVILGTGVHRRRRLPPLVTVIWCLYIPHCLVTAQRPQITCVYAGITWNDLYND